MRFTHNAVALSLDGYFGVPKFGYDLLVKQPKKPNAVELAAEKERIGNRVCNSQERTQDIQDKQNESCTEVRIGFCDVSDRVGCSGRFFEAEKWKSRQRQVHGRRPEQHQLPGWVVVADL